MKKVMVGGTFNSIHPGHEFFLNMASEFGDYLIVVIATDRTVMKSKGYLLKKEDERRELVEKLDIADKVLIGDDENFLKIVIREKPDIIVLGYDQDLDPNFRKQINDMDIKIERIEEKYGNYSTSKMTSGK